MKRKILSIWIGLCYISLTILLGACDEACCCPTPTTGLGTIFIFPDFVSNPIECQSPFTTINSTNFNGSDGAPCDEFPVWFATVRIGGTEGNDQCNWSQVYRFNDSPHGFTIVTLNGRKALKVTGVPLRNTTQLAIAVSIIEPKHLSGGAGCSKCPIKYSLTWQGTVGVSTVNNQEIFIPCFDTDDLKCCD